MLSSFNPKCDIFIDSFTFIIIYVCISFFAIDYYYVINVNKSINACASNITQ